MPLLLLGLLLLALKLGAVEPLVEWPWWWVLSPFALAVAWWVWADKTGHTRKQAMRKERARKEQRRRSLADGMGMLKLFDRKVAAKLRSAEERENASRRKQVDKLVAHRERQRQFIRDSVLTTRMDSQFDSQDNAASTKPGKP